MPNVLHEYSQIAAKERRAIIRRAFLNSLPVMTGSPPLGFAAGALIVEEAGGVVTTVEGGAVTLGQKCSVLATNGRCGRLE